MTSLATTTKLSNKARVERMPSGEVVVRDVPIFSEIRLGDPATKGPGGRPPLDEAWLQRAIELHNARADLGHLPPLNQRHTFNGPKNVGKYRLRRIDKVKVNPQDDAPRATIFGDEIFANEQAFEESKDHPYRSPEISPDWPEEFGPLALLREASPFNKYPNLEFEDAQVTAAAQAFEARGGLVFPCSEREAFETKSTPNPKEGAMPPEAVAPSKGDKPQFNMEESMKGLHSMMAKCFETISKIAESKGEKSDGKKAEGEQHAAEKPEDEKHASEKSEGKKEDEKKNDGVSSHEPPAVSSARQGSQFSAASPLPQVNAVEFFSMKTALDRLLREKDATGLCAAAERELASVGFTAGMVESLRPQMFAAACSDGKRGLDAILAPARTVQQQFASMPAPYQGLGQASRGAGGDPEDLAKALQTFGSRPGAADVVRSTYADYCAAPELQRLYSFEKICASDPRLNPAAGGRR